MHSIYIAPFHVDIGVGIIQLRVLLSEELLDLLEQHLRVRIHGAQFLMQ